MIKTLLATAITTLIALNNISIKQKPRNAVNPNQVILSETSQEAYTLYENSYFMRFDNVLFNQTINQSIGRENGIMLRAYDEDGRARQLLVGELYTLTTKFITNYPYIIFNDEDFYYFKDSNGIQSDTLENSYESGTIGILIPKNLINYDSEIVKYEINIWDDDDQYDTYIEIANKNNVSDLNPKGIDLSIIETPELINLNPYKPFTNSNNNLLSYQNSHTLLNPNTVSSDGHAYYHYETTLNDIYFISKDYGLSNYWDIFMEGNELIAQVSGTYVYKNYLYTTTNVDLYRNYKQTYPNKAWSEYIKENNGYYNGPNSLNIAQGENYNIWQYGNNSANIWLLEPNRSTSNYALKAHQRYSYETLSTDVTGDITDVFSLMALAFSSILPFMNFYILPNITIGVLIILPILFSLLMFLIHLFKRH